MKLEDAMADVYLRAVLKNPGRCPRVLLDAAKYHWEMWKDEAVTDETRRCTASFMAFRAALSASVQDLPAILSGDGPDS